MDPEPSSLEAPGPNPPRLPQERPGPEGGKRDRNRRERTAALMGAGLRLFLAHGIEPVTIDAIAREAGVAKGSFYRYFQGKRELVDAIARPVADRVVAAFDACRGALEQARAPLEAFFAYSALGAALEAAVLEQPQVARLYLQETRAPAIGARAPLGELAGTIARASIELTELAQRHGLIRQVDPAVSALLVVGAAERLLQAYLDGELSGAPTGLAAELVGIVMNGLQPGP